MSITKPPVTKRIPLSSMDLLFEDDKKIIPLIKECNDKYLYWDKVKYKTDNLKISNEQFWQLLKATRAMTANKIQLGKYIFSFNITNKITECLRELDLELNKNSQIIAALNNRDKQYFFINSLHEEAIASSIMEGAITTRKIAKEILRKNEKPKTKSLTMIVNTFLTMNYIIQRKDYDLNKELFLTVHNKITKNTLKNKNDEGNFRASNENVVSNVITNEPVYQPVDYNEINELVDQLCEICNNSNFFGYFIHPIIKAIIIHFLISFIHPFNDGNKRIARIIFYWYLLKSGYSLTEYISISRVIQKTKNQYEKSFLKSEYDDYDLTYFILYNLKVLIKAKNNFYEYLNTTLDKRKSLIYYIKKYKINENEARILKELNSKKGYHLTVKEVQTLLTVSNQTARSALDNLCDINLLIKRNLHKKKFGYELKEHSI